MIEMNTIHAPGNGNKRKLSSQENSLALFLTTGFVSRERTTDMLLFIVFIALLAMLYIGNHHHVEKSIRKINRLNKEIEELSWDHKTLQAELMLKSTRSEVAKKAASLGLVESFDPPKKIVRLKE